jgi:hypothetical protein
MRCRVCRACGHVGLRDEADPVSISDLANALQGALFLSMEVDDMRPHRGDQVGALQAALKRAVITVRGLQRPS